jgi:hypothetical protein
MKGNKNIVKALGIGGNIAFNIGKMALFFVTNGGAQSLSTGINYLKGLPKRFLEKNQIKPEDAAEVHDIISRDLELKRIYDKLSKIVTTLSDPIFDYFFNDAIAHKKDAKDYLREYNKLCANKKIMKIFIRTYNGILNSRTRQHMQEMYKFIDDVIRSPEHDAKKLNDMYLKYNGTGKYAPFRSGNLLSDIPTSTLTRIIQMYITGAALTSSEYDSDSLINLFRKKMGGSK